MCNIATIVFLVLVGVISIVGAIFEFQLEFNLLLEVNIKGILVLVIVS